MKNAPPAPQRFSRSPSRRHPGLQSERPVRAAALERALSVTREILGLAVTFRLGAWLRARRDESLIRRSGLFDARFYLAQCGDDPEARRDPIAHYLTTGAARGLEPTPLFDAPAWIARNPAAARRRRNPLVHFIRSRRRIAKAAPWNPTVTPRRISGEALLERHPFHAPAPRDVAPRALVMDAGPEASAAGAHPALLGTISHALRESGWSVTLAPEPFAEALAHLVATGHAYDLALVSGPEAAFAALPALRAYAPQAVVGCDPAYLRARWVAGSESRPSDDPGERLARLERVNAACADVVLAASPTEREALIATIAGVRAVVLVDVPLSPSAGSDLGVALLGAATHVRPCEGGGP